MEIIRDTQSWGNSAGVLLPREWLGNQVRVILIERSLDIKREVLRILEPYLDDILGIYLVGSYARGEETKKSDIDIIAISMNTKKTIISGKYNISMVTLDGIKKTLENHPELILPRIAEAKTIINSNLAEELKNIKISKESFREFINDTKRIIKIDKDLVDLDKEQGDGLKSVEVIYSLVLRLRGIFLINRILKKEKYKKHEFIMFLEKEIGKDAEKVYEIYEEIRDKRKAKIKVDIGVVEKLLNFLEREVSKW